MVAVEGSVHIAAAAACLPANRISSRLYLLITWPLRLARPLRRDRGRVRESEREGDARVETRSFIVFEAASSTSRDHHPRPDANLMNRGFVPDDFAFSSFSTRAHRTDIHSLAASRYDVSYA